MKDNKRKADNGGHCERYRAKSRREDLTKALGLSIPVRELPEDLRGSHFEGSLRNLFVENSAWIDNPELDNYGCVLNAVSKSTGSPAPWETECAARGWKRTTSKKTLSHRREPLCGMSTDDAQFLEVSREVLHVVADHLATSVDG